MILRRGGIALTLSTLVAVTACGGLGGRPSRGNADAAHTLTLLAGSELKDIEPFLDSIYAKTGVSLALTYSGTLAGIDRLNAGEQFDGAWFSHAKYLVLDDAGKHRVRAQEKIMLSPVVLGLKQSKARAFGWVDNPNVTWADIAAKVKLGQLHYAMTNPTASNSGFSAVIGVASALSHAANALTANDINNQQLRDFFQGQALTAGSSGWLAESFVRDQDRLDGMINYESILLSLNRRGQLREPLVLIYPKEGIVTADYPLVLLNDAKRAQYDTLVAYLKSAPFQRLVMTQAYRRPVNPDVPLDQSFPKNLIVELTFPSDIGVINQILSSYLSEARVPSSSYFLLDKSGSMQGQRLAQLQAALHTLSGDDSTLTGRFAEFQPRERVTFILFSSDVEGERQFTFDDASHMASNLHDVRTFADGIYAGGATAIYSALERAYQEAITAEQRDPNRYYSIVLMTDGENNRGASRRDFERYYRSLPAAAHSIKVFPILFGEGNKADLQALADLTGGRLFNGSTGSLAAVFKEIRGYQ